MTGHDDARGIEIVLLGVSIDPAQGAEAVLDRGRGEGDGRASVFDVDNIPAHVEEREEPVLVLLLGGTAGPAAAVDDHDRREFLPRLHLRRQVKVRLFFPVCAEVSFQNTKSLSVYVNPVCSTSNVEGPFSVQLSEAADSPDDDEYNAVGKVYLRANTMEIDGNVTSRSEEANGSTMNVALTVAF